MHVLFQSYIQGYSLLVCVLFFVLCPCRVIVKQLWRVNKKNRKIKKNNIFNNQYVFKKILRVGMIMQGGHIWAGPQYVVWYWYPWCVFFVSSLVLVHLGCGKSTWTLRSWKLKTISKQGFRKSLVRTENYFSCWMYTTWLFRYTTKFNG